MIYPASLLALGALALVLQNLIMVKISGQFTSPLIAMAVNSVVGITLLFALIFWRQGSGGLAQIPQALGGLGIIPGLLGTLFVFSSIYGYQMLGPTRAVTVLVAAQLTFGLLIDLMAQRPGIATPKTLLGVALLILGAVLVLSRSGE